MSLILEYAGLKLESHKNKKDIPHRYIYCNWLTPRFKQTTQPNLEYNNYEKVFHLKNFKHSRATATLNLNGQNLGVIIQGLTVDAVVSDEYSTVKIQEAKQRGLLFMILGK